MEGQYKLAVGDCGGGGGELGLNWYCYKLVVLLGAQGSLGWNL